MGFHQAEMDMILSLVVLFVTTWKLNFEFFLILNFKFQELKSKF